ncbi:hypothetical protein SAMN05421736_101568 [Evansella caseinilytica]|uniref:Uncharacterized protein n=1 Tax=Evansella caseinilytica TaxID=1503961 RepID=A0A1H3HQ27_9BACI|nr:hypothetical protein [Evansella caseinilytica]SDY17335.1 hypothetical protein SAMN05421736_101568 [Evansella caseinilytica]
MKKIPSGMDAIESDSAIVEVELHQCRDWLGNSFTDDGWYVFKELVNEYRQNHRLRYEKSILKTYYQIFQPETLEEALFGDGSRNLQPLNSGWVPFPWNEKLNGSTDYLAGTRKKVSGCQHFGPNSDHFGRKEFIRTILIYRRLLTKGYQPEKYHDGYIRGIFMRNSSDYRFKVMSGQHRLAALHSLGYNSLHVKVGKKRVIDIHDIDDWPHVKNGLYPLSVAEAVFHHYFVHNGKEKAQLLGLV